MFKEKSYTGVKTGYASTNVTVNFCGVNITTNIFLTDLFGETLETFLKNECGISDCKYDTGSKTVTIKGIPILYRCYAYNSSTVNRSYVDMHFPFISTGYGPFASGGYGTYYRQSFLYNSTTGEYTITFRILGEPTACFLLAVKSYITNYKSSSSSSMTVNLVSNYFPTFYLFWSKGRDLIRKKDFIAIASVYNSTFVIYEFEDGEMKSVKTGVTPNRSFNASADEKEEFEQTLPLIPWEIGGWYVWDGAYKYIGNIGLPSNSSQPSADSQLFVDINGETYLFFTSTSYGFIKVIN